MTGKFLARLLIAWVLLLPPLSCMRETVSGSDENIPLALVSVRANLTALSLEPGVVDSIRFTITSVDSPAFYLVQMFPYSARSGTAQALPCNTDLLIRLELFDNNGLLVTRGAVVLNNGRCDSLSITISDTLFTPLAPAYPTVSVLSEAAIQIDWHNRAADQTSFIIERARDTLQWVAIDTIADTTYLDDNLRSNTFYRYRISALNAQGRSPLVNAGGVSTPGPDITRPSLTIQSHVSGDTLNKTSFVVYGTAFDLSGVRSITVNQEPARLFDGYWISDSITFETDSIELTIAATDSSPSLNDSTLSLVLHYREIFSDTTDTIPPVIRLLSHRLNDTSATRLIRLYGLALDVNSIRRFTVNDSPVTVTDNFWEVPGIVLADSLNLFVLRAVDNSSDTNSVVDTVRIWYNPAHVVIPNRSPHFLVNPSNLSAEIKAGQIYRKVLVAGDPDSFNVLTFFVDTPLTLIDDTVIVYEPQLSQLGTHFVWAVVKDQDGAQDSIAWTIRVLDPSINLPPVFVSRTRDIKDSALIRVAYRDTLEASDPDQDSGLVFSKKNAPAALEISEAGVISWTPDRIDIGIHPCTAQVVDELGATALFSWKITVYDSSLPVVNAGKDTIVSIGDLVQLRGTATRRGGSIEEYAWDIGSQGVFRTTSGPDTSFSAGTAVDSNLVCVFRATDNFGRQNTDTMKVMAILDPPVANAGRDTALQTDQPFTLRGSATDRFGTIVKWEWDIGKTGTFVTTPDSLYSGITPSITGPFTCVLRVTDDDGNQATDEVVVNVIRLSMVLLEPEELPPPGEEPYLRFTMGSASGNADESPAHPVKLTPFWIDTVEVRQSEYLALMGVNPSGFAGANLPVDRATWFDAALFCNARSRRDGYQEVYTFSAIEGTAGNGTTNLTNLQIRYDKVGYRLPTEAEWEYACRGGSTTAYFWGADSTDIGLYSWYLANGTSKTNIVATKTTNPLGLYDMTGNVREWCNDWYSPTYYASVALPDTATNPRGPETTTGTRILRGGSWNDPAIRMRSATRQFVGPEWNGSFVGFRCVLPAR